MSSRTELPQGTLDLRILQCVVNEPQHGWAISERLQQISSDVLQGTAGVALPGATPVGAQGLDCGGVGDVGEQSEGEVLCADGLGEEAVGGGDGCVGEVDGGSGEGVEDSVNGVAWVWRGVGWQGRM
jgi:hypothetical protein